MSVSRKLLPILDKIDETDSFFEAIRLIDNDGWTWVDYSVPRNFLMEALERNRAEVKQMIDDLRQEAA